MRRPEFISVIVGSVIVGATAWPLGGRAERPVIGVLNFASGESIAHLLAAFRRI
jgi:hypothetical protein